MTEKQARIARIIQEYDSQGWHRTGTDVDAESALWLLEAARATGASAELQPFEFERFQPEECYVQAGMTRFDGLPLFDGSTTPAGAITGRIGRLGSNAEIGLLVLQHGDPEAARQLETARREGHHTAIVAVTKGGIAGLIAHNATFFEAPYGIPVLLVPSTAEEVLVKAVDAGNNATVAVFASRARATSCNLIARVGPPSSGDSSKRLMVTTPRTGWWHCAAERGGGIACWLETMRAISESRSGFETWFIAFAGHELGHLGLNRFLKHTAIDPAEPLAWLHFGANIGGASDPGVRVAASTRDDLFTAVECLLQAKVEQVVPAQEGRLLGLEAVALHDLGGRCISLLGGNAFFHMLEDRWPHAVDVSAVAKQAVAAESLLAAVAEKTHEPAPSMP